LIWTNSIPTQQVLHQAKEQADCKFHQSYQFVDAGLGSMEEAHEKKGTHPLQVRGGQVTTS